MQGEEAAGWFRTTFQSIKSEIGKVIVGQGDVVDAALMGLAANGHVLLEGMPGLGKTLLVRSLSEVLQIEFGRIQFTPDLMPADVTGTNVLSGGAFEFKKGPIFANLVLADEINRATPKTQAAMLEAMQERAVTVAGKRFSLPEPFLVMATQNPIEQEGTYPLPEAQLDRFFMKVVVPFPTRDDLSRIVTQTTGSDSNELTPVADGDAVLKMRQITREVIVSESVLGYAINLVLATHPDSTEAPDFVKRYGRYGSSPRGAQSLITAGKIRALLSGRYNVSKDDLKSVAKNCLRHRILLNFEAEADGVNSDRVVDEILVGVDKRDRDPVGV